LPRKTLKWLETPNYSRQGVLRSPDARADLAPPSNGNADDRASEKINRRTLRRGTISDSPVVPNRRLIYWRRYLLECRAVMGKVPRANAGGSAICSAKSSTRPLLTKDVSGHRDPVARHHPDLSAQGRAKLWSSVFLCRSATQSFANNAQDVSKLMSRGHRLLLRTDSSEFRARLTAGADIGHPRLSVSSESRNSGAICCRDRDRHRDDADQRSLYGAEARS